MALPFLFLLPSRLPFQTGHQRKKLKSEEFRKKSVANRYLLPVALAASRAAGYMSLQRPWDAEIVTVG
jgi:hypothetical protein